MVAYAKSGKHFTSPVAEIGMMLTEIEDRGERYGQGKTNFMVSFMWQIIRGLFARSPPAKANTRILKH